MSRVIALDFAEERDGAVFAVFFLEGGDARLTEGFFETDDLDDVDFAVFRADGFDPAARFALGRLDFVFNVAFFTDFGAERPCDVRRDDLLKPLVTGLLISRSKLGGRRPCKATQNSSRSLT
ncbi:MAG TPA: hypothetical protein VJM12_12525 [Pyrinomonadaceae bacterium]|nr:hypothetical protein [Pyrinomonadaceae bacterium]